MDNIKFYIKVVEGEDEFNISPTAIYACESLEEARERFEYELNRLKSTKSKRYREIKLMNVYSTLADGEEIYTIYKEELVE